MAHSRSEGERDRRDRVKLGCDGCTLFVVEETEAQEETIKAGEMAHGAKGLAANPDVQSLVSGTHKLEGENGVVPVVF